MPQATQVDEQLRGRELDIAIAERVMGYDWWRSKVSGKRCLFPEGRQYPWFIYRATGDEQLTADYDHQVPPYSTSIEAAMEVVEKLRTEHWCVTLMNQFSKGPQWYVSFETVEGETYATCDSLPEAICLAALKAVGAE